MQLTPTAISHYQTAETGMCLLRISSVGVQDSYAQKVKKYPKFMKIIKMKEMLMIDPGNTRILTLSCGAKRHQISMNNLLFTMPLPENPTIEITQIIISS